MVRRWVAGCLLVASIAVGSFLDTPRRNPRLFLGGYHILAADFHIHSFPFSWGVLPPWDTVIEARRQGLDVVAMTPHNHVWVATVGKWFSRLSGEPVVLVGEEIHSIGYHVIAVGITNTINWRQPASSAIDEVHKQGGIAIAAHPTAAYSSYDAVAMQKLDGAEVVHPLALTSETFASQLRQFFNRRHLTAIGDTDYHLGPLSLDIGAMGLCRTYVFVRERTEKDILDALREGRTVVYDRDHVYGDPALIRLASEDGRLPALAATKPNPSSFGVMGRITGLFGLLAALWPFPPAGKSKPRDFYT